MLLQNQNELLTQTAKAQKMIALQLEDEIGGYESLNDKQAKVAREEIAKAADTLLTIREKSERLDKQKGIVASLTEILRDRNAYEEKYNSIIADQANLQEQQESKQREQVSSLYSKMTAAYKERCV